MAAGIVGRTVALFSDPRSVRAAIGPCAGGCCYEVGEEVIEAVSAGTGGLADTERRGAAVFLDLAGTIRATLLTSGVESVDVSGECTIHSADRFFSHRREGRCGRQMAMGMRL